MTTEFDLGVVLSEVEGNSVVVVFAFSCVDSVAGLSFFELLHADNTSTAIGINAFFICRVFMLWNYLKW